LHSFVIQEEQEEESSVEKDETPTALSHRPPIVTRKRSSRPGLARSGVYHGKSRSIHGHHQHGQLSASFSSFSRQQASSFLRQQQQRRRQSSFRPMVSQNQRALLASSMRIVALEDDDDDDDDKDDNPAALPTELAVGKENKEKNKSKCSGSSGGNCETSVSGFLDSVVVVGTVARCRSGKCHAINHCGTDFSTHQQQQQ